MDILSLFDIILDYCKNHEDYSLLKKEIDTIEFYANSIDIRFKDDSVWYVYDGQLYKQD